MMGVGWRLGLRLVTVAVCLALAGAALLVPPMVYPEPGQARLTAYDGEASLAGGQWRQILEGEGYATRSVLSSPLILDGLEAPRTTAWVLLGAERPYRADESEAVQRFLARGGNLLVADTAGFANGFLTDQPVRFGPSHLLDERFRDDLAFVEAEARIGDHNFRLLLNNPVALLPSEEFQGTVISRSSDTSFLDVNANRQVDQADVPGPFPIIATWLHPGGGRIVLSADLGVFLNDAMEDAGYDHAAFHRALAILLLPEGGTVLIDESLHVHGPYVDALSGIHGAAVRVADSPLAWIVVAAVAAGALLAPFLVGRVEAWRRHWPVLRVRPVAPSQAMFAEVVRAVGLRVAAESSGVGVAELEAQGGASRLVAARDPLVAKAVERPQEALPADIETLIRRINDRNRS